MSWTGSIAPVVAVEAGWLDVVVVSVVEAGSSQYWSAAA